MLTNQSTIKLLTKNDNNLQINEDALKFIQGLQGPVCPCVIMGQYRTGKSFLLSRLFDSKSAFSVGHTDQPQTKGLWVSTEPFKVKGKTLDQQMNVILIDTEGLESFSSDDKWDTNLFLASLLLSSVLIYNTKNALAKDALNKLSVATCISEKIKFNSKLSAAMNETKLKEQGPDMFWIVRDFSLRTTKPAQEEFESILQYESIDSCQSQNEVKKKEIESRNEVRRSLRNAFYTLNCAYLPPPELRKGSKLDLDREELLQQLDKIDKQELNEKFNNKLGEISDQIKTKMRPKKVDDQYLDGPKYAEFIKQIVHSINKEQTFCLQDVMLSIIKTEADLLLAELKTKYEREVNSLAFSHPNTKPKSRREFEAKEVDIYDNSIARINQKLSYKPNLAREYSESFGKYRLALKNDVLKKLDEKNKSWDKKVLTDLWATKLKNKCVQVSPQYSNLSDLDKDFSQLKKEFGMVVTQQENLDQTWQEFLAEINFQAIRYDVQTEIYRKSERERLQREREEREKQEKERYERQRQERERQERLENERIERIRQDRERLERIAENERLEQARQARESRACNYSSFRESCEPAPATFMMPQPSRSYSHSGTAIGTIDMPRAGPRTVYEGPRGGQYTINANGNKTYLRK